MLKIAGALTPKFLLEHSRRRIALDLLGIPHGGPAAYWRTAQLAAHVERFRFDLWPEFLRRKLGPWSLVDVGANEGEFMDGVGALRAPAAIFAKDSWWAGFRGARNGGRVHSETDPSSVTRGERT